MLSRGLLSSPRAITYDDGVVTPDYFHRRPEPFAQTCLRSSGDFREFEEMAEEMWSVLRRFSSPDQRERKVKHPEVARTSINVITTVCLFVQQQLDA